MKLTLIFALACSIFFPFHFLCAELIGPQPPYRLQCGDRVHVTVYGVPSTKRVVIVDPSGNVNYLFAKNIPIRGQTLATLRDVLTKQMTTYFKDPLLMITLIDCLGEYYSIIGEVREPGYKRIEGNPTLLTAICEAKGFNTRLFREQTVDQADLRKSFLIRDGEYVPVDFERLVIHGDLSQDIPLKNGDYIYITATGLKKVFILGEVNSPSVVEFLHGMTLSHAVTEGGGITSSASSRVAVIRGGLTLPVRFLVDINRIIKGRAFDFPLEPGDIVYVPPMRFAVLKEIVKMGIANFISIVASAAGASAYVALQPGAGAFAAEAVTDAAISNILVPTPSLP